MGYDVMSVVNCAKCQRMMSRELLHICRKCEGQTCVRCPFRNQCKPCFLLGNPMIDLKYKQVLVHYFGKLDTVIANVLHRLGAFNRNRGVHFDLIKDWILDDYTWGDVIDKDLENGKVFLTSVGRTLGRSANEFLKRNYSGKLKILVSAEPENPEAIVGEIKWIIT